MKAKVIYTTGSGSTELLAKKTEEYFKSSSLFNISLLSLDDLVDVSLLKTSQLLILVFPVVNGRPCKEFRDFLGRLNVQREKTPVALIGNSRYLPGDALKFAVDKLRGKNYYTISYTLVNSKSTLEKKDSGLERILEKLWDTKIKKMVKQISDQVRNKTFLYQVPSPTNIIQNLYESNHFFRRRVGLQSDLCDNCKKCIDVCPCNCYREGINTPFINRKYCEDCLKCINACPKEAIEAEKTLVPVFHFKNLLDYFKSK